MRLTLALLRRLPVRRNHIKNFNNAWYLNRELELEESGDRQTLVSMGVPVYTAKEVIETPHVPPYEIPEGVREPEDVALGPLKRDEAHPNWKSRPVRTFHARTRYPFSHQLDLAKNLTKTVETTDGLPEEIETLARDLVITPERDATVENLIKESHIFDATQKKLPKNYRVPDIGWHPVNDRMTAKMPYPVTMSWGRNMPREFGIPKKRKTQNLTRRLFGLCDLLRPEHSDTLLNRVHYENKILRQYFERHGIYTRINVTMPFYAVSPSPLKPYSKCDTSGLDLPDIRPMESHNGLWPTNVYHEENNFAVLKYDEAVSSHVHTAVFHDNGLDDRVREDEYAAKALTLAFGSALAQARLRYGEDVSASLPEPVTLHFIHTDGRLYHFSVFQLNTLDLDNDDGVKNVFWHDKEPKPLYQSCEYQAGVPTLEGYDPGVFKKIAALYLRGA